MAKKKGRKFLANYNFKKRPRRQIIEAKFLENGSFYIFNKKKFLKFKNKYPKNIQDIVELNNYVRLKTLENSI